MDNADVKQDDKPFDDEPFNPGVEASEEEDPKKFIEQLTGKLGQSLRAYTESQGQPDFDLEKFAINSLLSATHTAEMTPEDQKDIISKVKKSGAGDDDVAPESNDEPVDGLGDDLPTNEPTDGLSDGPVDELTENGLAGGSTIHGDVNLETIKFILHTAFADLKKFKGNDYKPTEWDILNFFEWYYTQGKDLNENFGGIIAEFINTDKLTVLSGKKAFSREEMHDILRMIYNSVDISGQYRVGEVIQALGFPYGEGEIRENKKGHSLSGTTAFPWRYDGEEMDNLFLTNVPKSDLFQPGNEISESDNLINQEKNSIFDKDYLRQKLAETFKQDDSMIEPQVAPVAPEVKPSVTPIVPKRKNQPFLPMPEVQPDPKANS